MQNGVGISNKKSKKIEIFEFFLNLANLSKLNTEANEYWIRFLNALIAKLFHVQCH